MDPNEAESDIENEVECQCANLPERGWREGPALLSLQKMSHEVVRLIPDAHAEPLTCAAFNKFRREVYSGAQDGLVKAGLALRSRQ